MGEKITNLGKFFYKGKKFNIELNHSSGSGKSYEIHLQSDDMRYELNETEFNQLSTCILLACENLKKLKKIQS